MQKKDLLVVGSDFELSLSRLVGKTIMDVRGYISAPFGDDYIFLITTIAFEDGSKLYVEGEHDVPYIPADDRIPNMDEDTLRQLAGDDEE